MPPKNSAIWSFAIPTCDDSNESLVTTQALEFEPSRRNSSQEIRLAHTSVNSHFGQLGSLGWHQS